MKISKYSGNLLTATGILHILIVIVLYGTIFFGMIADGFFNTVGNDPLRIGAIWNLVVGVLLITWGTTLQYYQKQT